MSQNLHNFHNEIVIWLRVGGDDFLCGFYASKISYALGFLNSFV